ncbi:MAG: class I SAM-dependent methyltransferase [Chloroflexi bacterium]|nr:class I SAM-dependent methyltransferase [Chloroflexota bacterium]
MADITVPRIDTDYQFEHVMTGAVLPDLDFLWRRMSEAMVATVATLPPGRVLDVGSGPSRELFQLAELGWDAYAVDPSNHMLGVTQIAGEETEATVKLVRAIGERLPFADASLDVVACQAALDHFADRHAFMKEAARVIKPGGRVVISLNNFEGLATKLGRLLHPLAKRSRLHHCADWPCWQIPPDHMFKGDWPLVKQLGGSYLTLERAYGVSLLCMFYGWGHLLSRLPDGVAQRALGLADRIAHGRPAWSDVIVSVWRPAAR